MEDDSKDNLISFPFEEEARRGHRIFEDGVVRWAAIDIARWAGALKPRNVKDTVEDNREEFERFGGLPPVRANPGPSGGRPGEEYWLNFEQALLLCVFLRSSKAADVRHVLIRITSEVVSGRLLPATASAQSVLTSLLDIQRQNAELLQKMDRRQDRVETDVATIKQQNQLTYMTALEALDLARKIAAQMPTRRRDASLTTAAICKEINWRMFEGRCPRDGRQIIERLSDGTLRCLPNVHLHHHFGRDRRHPTEMCYVDGDCNQALEDPLVRAQFSPIFSAIQIVVRAYLTNNGQLSMFEETGS
jgi:hypothetical protein